MINHRNGLREFGKFRLDLDKRLLWLGGEPVALPLKAVDLLCVLVANQGAVVSKEEIWHEVWNDAFIEETNLTHNIYLLRKAFKDLGDPDLIKTVPRRGYRFIAPVARPENILTWFAGLLAQEDFALHACWLRCACNCQHRGREIN